MSAHIQPFSREGVFYPEQDGKPMGETEYHINEIINTIQVLQDHFADRDDVYVIGDMFVYYEEGVPSSVVCPDTFVVFGVDKHTRRVFKIWEEGRAPSVVIEFTSRSTRLEDLGQKKEIYREIGVEEYFIFDPLAEHLQPCLRGYRRGGDELLPMVPGPEGRLQSRSLGLGLVAEQEHLVFYELASGRRLPTRAERALQAEAKAAQAQREAAQAQREAEQALRALEKEEARRRLAEKELAALRAELLKLRG